MAPKFDPASCPKLSPPPPISCLDATAARQCVCSACTCGKHSCVPTQSSRFQPLDIRAADARFQGDTEYTSKYDLKNSNANRKTTDGITLKGCFPTGEYYPKSVNSEYTSHYVIKPVFPGKAWKAAPMDYSQPTFAGRTTYADSYLKWGTNLRDTIRPPGFEPSKEPFMGTTMYTTHYCNKSRPEQPWRKLEHFPHKYSLCEVNHPTRSGAYKVQDERARVVGNPPSILQNSTTYGACYMNWGEQENSRTIKPIRRGPKTEAFVGHTTYLDTFEGLCNDKKCPVMMRPKPTATVRNHQSYP